MSSILLRNISQSPWSCQQQTRALTIKAFDSSLEVEGPPLPASWTGPDLVWYGLVPGESFYRF